MGRTKIQLPIAAAVGLALTGLLPAAAVTVVSCQDRDGSVFFADRCPPGTAQVGQKEVRGGPRHDAEAELAAVEKAHPVVLYTVSDCDACDLVRQQLRTRNIPYTEKDVGPGRIENQEALRALGDGNLVVPTVAVGAQVFTGYSRAALDLGLDTAGYPPRPQLESTEPAPVPAANPTAAEDAIAAGNTAE